MTPAARKGHSGRAPDRRRAIARRSLSTVRVEFRLGTHVCRKSGRQSKRLLFRLRNRDVAKLQSTGVVALDIEGSGFAFVGVKSPTRDAFNLFRIHDGGAVANNRDGPAD